ncbi:carboxypeptidase-like regulatory domain-containing protein [Calditrichota bacterium]
MSEIHRLIISSIAVSMVIAVLLSSCAFDPVHDNPNDPAHTAYQPFGELKLTVLTRNNLEPIENASVTVLRPAQEGRIRLTNEDGQVIFSQLPEGIWQVIAERVAESPKALYGRDTLEVNISQETVVDTFVQLNALPSFETIRASSIAYVESDKENIILLRYIRLTAQVKDPDGVADISQVEWYIDSLNMSGQMQFYPITDSSYWEARIYDEDFPGGRVTDVHAKTIRFVATDQVGQFSVSDPTLVVRILKNPPSPIPIPFPDIPEGQTLAIRWYFYGMLDDFERDTTEFHYRLRLFSVPPEKLIYDTLLVPTLNARYDHDVALDLSIGNYYYEIWIQDHFLNTYKALPEFFQVVTDTSQPASSPYFTTK